MKHFSSCVSLSFSAFRFISVLYTSQKSAPFRVCPSTLSARLFPFPSACAAAAFAFSDAPLPSKDSAFLTVGLPHPVDFKGLPCSTSTRFVRVRPTQSAARLMGSVTCIRSKIHAPAWYTVVSRILSTAGNYDV